MISKREPGRYIPGEFGIRLEDMTEDPILLYPPASGEV